MAAGSRADTGDHAQQRGFAAAGRADQYGKFAILDGQIQIFDNLVAAKCLGNFNKLNFSHCCFPLT